MTTANLPPAPPAHAATDADALAGHKLYRFGLAYGRAVYRVRWLVVVAWVILLGASLPFAAQITSAVTGGGYDLNASESTHVGDIATGTLKLPKSQITVVFQSAGTLVSDDAFQQQVRGFQASARDLRGVRAVTLGPTGHDGHTTYAVVSFTTGQSEAETMVPAVRQAVPAGPARAYLTDGPAIYREFTEITNTQNEQAEVKALPVALLALVIVFGTLVAAGLPLLLALVAVPISLAGVYFVAQHYTTSVFVVSIATIVGLGISIDYSLFMLRRFRDELRERENAREAVAWTVATAGEAILFSGLTVIIGFAAMLLLGLGLLTSMGIGGMFVVGVAVVAALTLLPAVLGILGHRVNALRVPLLGRLVAKSERAEGGRFWHGLAMGVMRRPVLVLVAVSALLIAIGWPIFSLNVGTANAHTLPASAEARQGLELLNKQYPDRADYPVVIALESTDGSSMLSDANIRKVDAYTTWLTQRGYSGGVTSLTQFPIGPQGQALPKEQLFTLYSTGAYAQVPGLRDLVASLAGGNATLITMRSTIPVNTPAGADMVRDLRAHRDAAGGLTVSVGGFQAISHDFNGYLYANFPRAVVFILVATYILLLLMFRSVFLPLKAILMNVLSVAAAYGVLVAVFQWGVGASLLGYQNQGFIDSTIPIMLFCILFGLSMDYEVFLLSRIREEWHRTQNNTFAVARGVEKTGGVITNAALLFVIVTAAFAFTSITITKEAGVGMTAAVLVDAVIIRSLLVPATMRLLGRWNWWLPGTKLPPKQVA